MTFLEKNKKLILNTLSLILLFAVISFVSLLVLYAFDIVYFFSSGNAGLTHTVRLFVKIIMPGFAPAGFFT